MTRIEGGPSQYERAESKVDQLLEIGNYSADAIMSRHKASVTNLINRLEGFPTDISEESTGWKNGILTVLKKADKDDRLSRVDPPPEYLQRVEEMNEVVYVVEDKGYLSREKGDILADYIVDALLNGDSDDGYTANTLLEGFQKIYNSTLSNTELRDEDYRTYDRNLGKIAGMLQILNQPNLLT